ncbi:MAG TPA: glycosyltransferase family 2 protein [Candidatus Sulfopaludibacter sp.]|jgi:GT2 family glycosyltransferase|nr:glycosyltransferase family 2 protein [Candidatus Sulfopaludibacter sp.]
MNQQKVCVTIVTCNSGRYIRRCLESLLRQEGVALEVIVVDNASTDNTREILEELQSRAVRTIYSEVNLGFAEGQNRAIRASDSEWVLTLNPDVLMRAGFLRHLLDAAQTDAGVGTVCGKLLSIGAGFEPLPDSRIDSAGIYFTPAMRHFDRGWHERDERQFDRTEYVFGATAAAALYRREMIDDISVDGEFFDPDFFLYREDADVAWRAMLMGWRCLYTPAATAYHVRTANPANRRSLPAVVNMHSVKNRFLMRIKNVTPGLYRRYWLPMTARDLLVLAGTLLWEPSSLAAYWHLAKALPRTLARRKAIMSRRRLSDAAIGEWFGFAPITLPVIPTSDELRPVRTTTRRYVPDVA